MKNAILRGAGLSNDTIFDVSSSKNRDNCFAPYALLRQRFLDFGISLHTADLADSLVEFELHQDFQSVTKGKLSYLLMFETAWVKPENRNQDLWTRYRRIFTWDDSLVDGERFIKLNFPNPVVIAEPNGFAGRHIFCCLIAGNKLAAINDEFELYTERVRSIKWFESNATADFHLYGMGWDAPAERPGVAGKILRRLWPYISRFFSAPFPSYRGRVDSKAAVLRHARFSICYENVRDLPGYITEKIFDCFFSGCVPVYWGASNITDHVPANCFVDRRKFRDTADVYRHLKAMGEDEYRGYQRNIADFLGSEAVRSFSSEAFAETIVTTVLRDVGDEA